MKLIIIEGSDGFGKNTLMKGICEHYNYDNIIIRHFGKPPKNIEPNKVEDFQWNCFSDEANFILQSQSNFDRGLESYYKNIFIWNRSHLGEYVYSTMFRGGDKEFLANQIRLFEDYKFKKIDVHLILLTGSPAFGLKQEDGHSFSQTIENKAKEIELFHEVFNITTIKNKLKLYVHPTNSLEFIDKEILLDTVIKFIEQ